MLRRWKNCRPKRGTGNALALIVSEMFVFKLQPVAAAEVALKSRVSLFFKGDFRAEWDGNHVVNLDSKTLGRAKTSYTVEISR
jgi:hypothetical protein